MNLEQILNSLIKYKAEIIKKLSANHWHPYFLIKEKYSKDILDDEFKKCFCSFYVMNGPMGLNDFQKNEFFRLVSAKENDLESILRVLHEIKGYGKRHKLFLSFGTKLLHTIDNNLPIYDRNIAYVLKLKNQTAGAFEIRIKNRIDIYNELKNDFALLLENSKIGSYLKDIRGEIYKSATTNHFEWKDNLVSDTKLLDSSLWALYDFIRKDKKIKCQCEEPFCAKCLLVNCKDLDCEIHTELKKIEFRARYKNR